MKEEQGLTLRDSLNIIYRRINVLRFMLIVLPLGVLFACLIVTPVYECTAKVIVTAKKENAALLQSPGDHGSSAYINLNVDETDLNSETELLSSPDLWIRTVKALGLKFFDTEKQKKAKNQDWFDEIRQTVRDLMSSSPLASISGTDTPDKPDTVQDKARELIGRFTVRPAPKSKILDLSLKYSDPEKAEQILSKLLELYIPYHLEVYSLPGAENFFSGQRDIFKEKYLTAEKHLNEFKTKWQISSPEKQKSELIALITQMEDSLIKISTNLTQYQTILDSLNQGSIPTGQLAPTMDRGNENTVINIIVTQLLRATQKKLQVAQEFAESSREMSAAVKVEDALKDRLRQAITTEMDILTAKKKTLESSLQEKRVPLAQLEDKNEEARRLQLAVSVAKERYLQYIAKEEEARLEKLKGRGNLVTVSVVSKPFAQRNPIFPKTLLFVVASIFVALFLGLGLVLLGNFFDHTFDGPRQVEAFTGYPCVAVIGRLPKS